MTDLEKRDAQQAAYHQLVAEASALPEEDYYLATRCQQLRESFHRAQAAYQHTQQQCTRLQERWNP